jgi:serine/threonine protein kinase
VSPEVLEGKKASMASDMGSFGIILYKSFFNNGDVILMPNQQNPKIPVHENINLIDLLHKLLQRDPSKRISAEEALTHPFFTMPISIQQPSEIIDSDSRISALRSFLSLLKKNEKKTPKIITLRRNNIVEDVFNTFSKLNNMMDPIRVMFEGEDGIDAGALTTSMYHSFFSEIFHPKYNLFQQGKEGGHYIPNKSNNELDKFELFGKVLIRLLLDERIVSIPLSSSVLKYLKKEPTPLTMRDLETYDNEMYRNLSSLLAFPGSDQLELDFSGLVEHGDQISVNDSNKNKYVSLKVKIITFFSSTYKKNSFRRYVFYLLIIH